MIRDKVPLHIRVQCFQAVRVYGTDFPEIKNDVAYTSADASSIRSLISPPAYRSECFPDATRLHHLAWGRIHLLDHNGSPEYDFSHLPLPVAQE